MADDAPPSRGAVGARVAAMAEHPLAPLGAAVLATGLWSIGNLLAAGAGIPGPQLAFWRILFGAIAYGSVYLARGGRFSATGFRTASLGGAAFGLSAVLFFSAFQLTTVASATVIAALQPVLLVPYTTRRMGEKVDGPRMVLILVAVAGTATVVLGSSSSSGEWSLVGDLLALGGTVVGCAYFVGTKTARATMGTLEYQASAMPIAAMVALGGALVTGPGLVTPSWLDLATALVMMAVPGTGHLFMSWSQKHLDVTTTATVALDVNVLSSAGAALIYGQTLQPVQLLGMAVVLVALALFVHRAGRSVADPAEIPVVPGE